MRGSLRYFSVRAHQGIQQSRRDELESVIYVLMHWRMGGKLPWSGFDCFDSDISHKIMRAKIYSSNRGVPSPWRLVSTKRSTSARLVRSRRMLRKTWSTGAKPSCKMSTFSSNALCLNIELNAL